VQQDAIHADEEVMDVDEEYNQSKWKAMRLKKHFTVQTNLMLKENETAYVGSFAVSSELRTIKKSPLSFLPFFNQLFSRTEFMLVKNAILVFITARPSRKGEQKYPTIKPYRQEEKQEDIALPIGSNRHLDNGIKDESDEKLVWNKFHA